MNRKILFVDDEAELLNSFRRQLRYKFEISTATSGLDGLDIAKSEGPFAVIVSDMHMPLMNGIEFLSRVESLYPDTIRIMLTGKADLTVAINAVNEGRVFRLLTKPCDNETIILVLNAAVRQFQLENAERELLRDTFRGSIKILLEILNMINPAEFSRTTRSTIYLNHIVKELKLKSGWIFELALSLSQIGLIAFPEYMIDMVYYQEELSKSEKRIISEQHEMGRKLLENIPRLENVGKMIEFQQQPFREFDSANNDEKQTLINLGAQILMICLDLDELVIKGFPTKEAISEMQKREGVYNPKLLAAMNNFKERIGNWNKHKIEAQFIKVGMVVDDDIHLRDGSLLICKGQEITEALQRRLQILHNRNALQEPIYVLVPYKN
ncbi:MAG: response regulator [Anaerolineaceae bacterium]|nr:response regulator [Anaerolineaceae bacterium]